MDNVTHSLAGALLAEAWIFFHQRRSGKQGSAAFPRAALFISVLGSNLPDADMLYTGLTPSPLGYLLHHRGHTHTLLPIAVVLGALSALAVLGVVRWKWSITRPEAYGIMVLGVLSPIAHIAMDAGNIYGVHPFWPVHDGWFYGDSVFILEPLFWVTALPVLLAQARSRGWRFLLALLLLLGVGLPWLVPGFVPLGLRVLIAALALVVSLVAWKAKAGTRLAASIGAWAAVSLVFVSVGVAARTKFGATLQQAFPAERVYDLALSPLPANPFCWTAISVATDPQDNLVLRRATLAPIPALLKASACPSMATAGTAPMSAMDEPDTEGLRWNGRFKAPLAQLRELAAERCEVRALLRFVRVPYWTTAPGNKVAIVGDLRFDRDERLDFADMAVPDGPSTCPPFVPPWIPPRSDLLR